MIEDLKRIMNDEARPPAEREAAAKHILRLQAEEQDDFAKRIKNVIDDLLNESHYEPAKSSGVNAKESSPHVEPTDGPQPATKQPITSKQVTAALRWCDLELERLNDGASLGK